MRAHARAPDRTPARLNVNAVVLVGNRDGVLYERAIGYGDLESKPPMTVSTKFKIEGRFDSSFDT